MSFNMLFNQCILGYLTGSFESNTNIPAVSKLASLCFAALLVQEDSGLLLESLFVLQEQSAKVQTIVINMQHSVLVGTQNTVMHNPYLVAGSKQWC